jgi:hypothetical protein
LEAEKQNELGALPNLSKTPFSEPLFHVSGALTASIKSHYEISGLELSFFLATFTALFEGKI